NIRELRNLIERATLLADGDTIEQSHLTAMADDIPPAPPITGDAFQLSAVVTLEALEKRYLDWARSRPGSDPATLADRLGISQRTLYRKLQAQR
ncbi:MAG TPA: AAA family ATPase, partial [Azonexus sp.]|nr:AAA family ATPase [Azonexus sp.]